MIKIKKLIVSSRGDTNLKEVKETLFEAAVELIEKRYPIGWGGAAAAYTNNNMILTSVAPDIINASTELCIETGAILEAHKLEVSITDIICVVRENENSEFKLLAPCGICQERLFYWDSEVRAGIKIEDEIIVIKTLEELQPYHWYKTIKDK